MLTSRMRYCSARATGSRAVAGQPARLFGPRIGAIAHTGGRAGERQTRDVSGLVSK